MAGMAPCGYYKARILRIELGDDADNVRVDTSRHRVLVGYGKGTLAIIDPVSRSKTADLRLNAHPDSFQIDETGSQVFVNVPDAGEIEIVDLAAEGEIQSRGRAGHVKCGKLRAAGESDRQAHLLRRREPEKQRREWNS